MNEKLMELIATHISDDLSKRISDWLVANPIEIYWDYDYELNSLQIDQLLAGGHYEFNDDLWESLMMDGYMYAEEVELERNCIAEFLTEMLAGLTIDEDDIDADDIDYLSELLQLRYDIHTNLNEDQLVRNARVRITLDLELEHERLAQNQYESAEPILDFFNVNPREVWIELYGDFPGDWPSHEQPWPNIPERSGNEYVELGELIQSWLDMYYSGVYVALLGGRTDLLTASRLIEEGDEKGKYLEVILPPGTAINSHDYWNGSGGSFFYLKKEMRIRITKEDQLCRDGKYSYGVDTVHGLVSEIWDRELNIEVMEEDVLEEELA